MASTSNVIQGADGEAENSEFSLANGLTCDLPSRRDVSPIYKYLDALKHASPNSVDGSQTHWTAGGEAEVHTVAMQILSLPVQEKTDLLLIYPSAEVRENRITTKEYIFVLKRYLFYRKVSGDDMSEVPFSHSFARLLRRLSRELRSALTGGFKFACTPDPLYDLLRDIEETDGEILQASEETEYCVYVNGNIDLYVECLLAAASELSTC